MSDNHKCFKINTMVFGFLVLLSSCARKPPYYADINKTRVYLEVAADPASRRMGLMFRDSLDKDKGMLFIFPHEEVVSFWMENTYIPLDIAFINDSGLIVKTAELRPHDRSSVSSDISVRYALEVNKGFFRKHSIIEGNKVVFSEAVMEIDPR